VKPTVYVIVAGHPFGGRDLAGMSMTADGEVLYQHVSSNENWLRSDVTDGFADRKAALAERYPDGFEVEMIDGWSNAPQALKDAFEARKTESAPVSPTPYVYGQHISPAQWQDEPVRDNLRRRIVETIAPEHAAGNHHRLLVGDPTEEINWLKQTFSTTESHWSDTQQENVPVLESEEWVETPEEATVGYWRFLWPDSERLSATGLGES
jgi:hypothetical protein